MKMLIRKLLLYALMMCMGAVLVSSTDMYLNISFPSPNITVNDYERFSLSYNVTVYHTLRNTSRVINLPIRPIVSYDKVIQILNCSLSSIPVYSEVENYSGVCDIQAYRLGGTMFNFEVNQNFTYNVTQISSDFKIIILHALGPKETIFRVLTTIYVVVLTFFIGCGLDPVAISDYVKKPVAPMIGFFSQFLVMPLIAFGLSQVSNLEPAFGFGLITIGCSPGGGASNIWTALLHGDLNLSMTMTFLSSVAAMGMMPLWIFILGRYFIDYTKVTIPYGMIAVNLLDIVIPVLLGMLLRYKLTKLADRIHKCTEVLAISFIIYIFTYGTWVNIYIYKIMRDYLILVPICAGLPWLGFVIGFAIAFAFKRDYSKSVTIALETGIQNFAIPILILLYSMPQPEGTIGGIMPIIIAIVTPFPLYIAYMVLLIYQYCCRQRVDKVNGDIQKCNNESAEDDSNNVQYHPIDTNV